MKNLDKQRLFGHLPQYLPDNITVDEILKQAQKQGHFDFQRWLAPYLRNAYIDYLEATDDLQWLPEISRKNRAWVYSSHILPMSYFLNWDPLSLTYKGPDDKFTSLMISSKPLSKDKITAAIYMENGNHFHLAVAYGDGSTPYNTVLADGNCFFNAFALRLYWEINGDTPSEYFKIIYEGYPKHDKHNLALELSIPGIDKEKKRKSFERYLEERQKSEWGEWYNEIKRLSQSSQPTPLPSKNKVKYEQQIRFLGNTQEEQEKTPILDKTVPKEKSEKKTTQTPGCCKIL